MFARGGTIDGLIVAVLGWFLFASARAEQQAGAARHALEGITVADMMRPVRGAPGWLTVAALLAEPSFPAGAVLMLESWGAPGYGAVVARDALEAVPPFRRHELRALDLGVPVAEVRGAQPDDDVMDALAGDGRPHILLVVADNRTVGAVLPADVERYVRTGERPPTLSSAPAAGEADGRGAPVH